MGAVPTYDPLRTGRWPGESGNVSVGPMPFGYRGPKNSAITLAPEPEVVKAFPVYSYRTMVPAGLEPDARSAWPRIGSTGNLRFHLYDQLDPWRGVSFAAVSGV